MRITTFFRSLFWFCLFYAAFCVAFGAYAVIQDYATGVFVAVCGVMTGPLNAFVARKNS